MEFDIQKFTGTVFRAREEDVEVPDLAPYFKGLGDQGKPVWRVRGLTGAELAKVNEAKERNRARSAIADGLLSSQGEAVTAAVRELLGEGDAVPDDLAKRIEMLVIGSVAPECTHQLATKLAGAFPVEFYQLTTKITQLTGMGGEPGKPKRSSSKATSAPPSSSAT
ncbi:hypothetical protein [Modicisalibacter luteus]|uniref:Tail assembly chaperone n=1 Tax=Modicisalibacter luteus TaxID=453962 RepID=A0ABV7M4S4_9GAMM|nr:hypothetical protein [Halomonas lutea]GHA85448.1 hypothetical protein GCM10007159_03200 [Halomonas lutea]